MLHVFLSSFESEIMEVSTEHSERARPTKNGGRTKESVQSSGEDEDSCQYVLNSDYDKDRRDFKIIFVLISIIAGIQALILVYALSQWLHGFRWHPDYPQPPDFNVHMVCNFSACIILTACANLIFRAFPNHSHRKLAVIHTVIGVLVVLITAFGVRIAHESHHVYGRNHLYSFHSWIGVSIFALLFFELITGNWIFFNEVVHGSLTNCHRFCGQMIFLFSVPATFSGILTAEARALGVDIKDKARRAATLNVFGLLTMFFVILSRYLQVEYRFRRRSRPDLEEKDISEHEVVLSIVQNKANLTQSSSSVTDARVEDISGQSH